MKDCRTLKCRNMDCFWLKVANPQANDVHTMQKLSRTRRTRPSHEKYTVNPRRNCRVLKQAGGHAQLTVCSGRERNYRVLKCMYWLKSALRVWKKIKLQGTQTDRAYRIIRSRIGKQKSLITREYKLVLTMSRSKYFNRNILRLWK